MPEREIPGISDRLSDTDHERIDDADLAHHSALTRNRLGHDEHDRSHDEAGRDDKRPTHLPLDRRLEENARDRGRSRAENDEGGHAPPSAE